MNPPDLILLNDHGGDWSQYIETVHGAYIDMFVRQHVFFRGLRVTCLSRPIIRGFGKGFWHLVQEGRVEEDRIPDIRRCERIRWIGEIIQSAGISTDIDIWENVRDNKTSVLLWYNEEYLVVLGHGEGYWLLKTAYCTEYRNRKAALRKERDAFIRTQQG